MFSGTMPEEMKVLDKLKTFMIQYNHLSGTIPIEVCNNMDCLSNFWADCNSTLKGEKNYYYLECSCCNRCAHNI